MKILVLTWEFPPRIVGGIARHVAELYPELVKLGHEVTLITVEFGLAPHYEVVDGVHVHRVSVPAGDNFFHWITNMNTSMGQHGVDVLRHLKEADSNHHWLGFLFLRVPLLGRVSTSKQRGISPETLSSVRPTVFAHSFRAAFKILIAAFSSRSATKPQ